MRTSFAVMCNNMGSMLMGMWMHMRLKTANVMLS